MGRYELSEAAALDFENIFNFGIDTFGLAQALEYQRGLIKRFQELAEQPELYAAVGHIRAGYRRSVYTSHSVYYQIEPSRVFIVRILGQQDPHKAMRIKNETSARVLKNRVAKKPPASLLVALVFRASPANE